MGGIARAYTDVIVYTLFTERMYVFRHLLLQSFILYAAHVHIGPWVHALNCTCNEEDNSIAVVILGLHTCPCIVHRERTVPASVYMYMYISVFNWRS